MLKNNVVHCAILGALLLLAYAELAKTSDGVFACRVKRLKPTSTGNFVSGHSLTIWALI